MADTSCAPIFKVMMIGDVAVGKTSLLLKYTEGTFIANLENTICVDFKIKTYTKDDKTVQLQLWDTAGQEAQSKTLNTFTSSCFRGAHGIVLVYDITDEASFSDVHNWLLEINKYGKEDCFKIIVGNKVDLSDDRAVAKEDAENYAQDLGLSFIETSAATGFNVEKAFSIIADEIIDSRKDLFGDSSQRSETIDIKTPVRRHSSITGPSGGCCK